MFSKEEKKLYNEKFWGTFKKSMQKYRSQNGKRINWLNYQTHVKYIFVRLEANEDFAAINFDIQPKDDEIRKIIWEQMIELKQVLSNSMNGDTGIWIEDEYNDSVGNFSRIKWQLDHVNYFREEDIHKIYSFFKEKLIGIDDFYSEFGEIIILLSK